MEYKLIRSKRKSLAIEVKDGNVIVRAPLFVSQKRIDEFVTLKEKWIVGAVERNKARLEAEPNDAQIKELKKMAEEYIPDRLKYYSDIMGLYPTSLKITAAKTRHGSCSGKNGICFSYRLMRYPLEAVDYVIVHELAHIKHKNHGKQFYALIAKYMPDYRERNKLLKIIPKS